MDIHGIKCSSRVGPNPWGLVWFSDSSKYRCYCPRGYSCHGKRETNKPGPSDFLPPSSPPTPSGRSPTSIVTWPSHTEHRMYVLQSTTVKSSYQLCFGSGTYSLSCFFCFVLPWCTSSRTCASLCSSPWGPSWGLWSRRGRGTGGRQQTHLTVCLYSEL